MAQPPGQARFPKLADNHLDFSGRKDFVASASQQQVREPLHSRSVERWRHYAEALQPVLSRLHAIAERDALEAPHAVATS